MTAVPVPIASLIPQQAPWCDGREYPSESARTLWARVEETRSSVSTLRRTVPGSSKHLRSRREHRDALQAYTDCLLAHRRPVPYQLRDELRLLQLTCASDQAW